MNLEFVFSSLTKAYGSSRKWIAAGCDGSPYILGSRLIDNMFVCPSCKTDCKGVPNFEMHMKEHDVMIDKELLDKCRKYKNIFLIPGSGHIEINMVKGAFKLFWYVFLKDLAIMLGFRSLKAQTCCQMANDHHKSLQIIEIVLFGLADELLYEFCLYCVKHNRFPTVDDYFSWCENVKNENYLFVSEAVFTYLLSIYLFRAAVRRNNSPLLLASRMKFCPIFFATNMTHYQELHVRDCILRSSMPTEIKSFVEATESFSLSGHPSKGEGGDFILESKNRRTKMWLPTGLPTEENWMRVCRNQDRLEKIRKTLNNVLGFSDDDSSTCMYTTDLAEEIFQWRTKIRRSGYLHNIEETKKLSSMTKEILDDDLINFSVNAKANYRTYLKSYNDGTEIGKGEKLTPVFVLKQDREKFYDISKKSKSTLAKQIANTLHEIDGTEEGEILLKQWTTEVKVGTKNQYISFYKELLQAVHEATTTSDE